MLWCAFTVHLHHGGFNVNVEELRRAIEGLPDDMELTGEAAYGQQAILDVEVCTYEYDLLHHAEGDRERLAEREDFNPDLWIPLEEPTLKISLG